MDFLKHAVLYPDAAHYLLLKIIVTILTFIYFTYIAVFTGGFSLSLLFLLLNLREPTPYFKRFSTDLIEFVARRRNVMILLGILPLGTLIFTYAQIYQDTSFRIVQYLAIITLLNIFGFFFASSYRALASKEVSLQVQFGSGLIGIGFFGASYFIFSNIMSLQLLPEKWGVIPHAVPFFVYEHVLPRFLFLTAFIFAMTGISLLFFFFVWPERIELPDFHYARFIQKFCGALAFIFVLFQPILLIWEIKTFPSTAKSTPVFALWMLALLLLGMVALFLPSTFRQTDHRYFTPILVLFLGSFLTLTITDQIASGNASRDKAKKLIARAEQIHQEVIARREERIAASMKIDGAEVFQRICFTCHRFDQRLVGPPLNTVKGKYGTNIQALQAFILNPVKVNPDFPPMPNPGVNRFEAEAVAGYLLEQWGIKAKTERK